MLQTWDFSFFKQSTCTQKMSFFFFFFFCLCCKDDRSEVVYIFSACAHMGVSGRVAGCRLRFSTSVRLCAIATPDVFNFVFWVRGCFFLLQKRQFFKKTKQKKNQTMNAKKPGTVCCNTFSPVGGSAAPCTQDRGANHSGYQGTSGEQLQVLMVMAFSFFTCRYCTLTAAFSFWIN